jgi:pimeloyl-ACP methyl ester carboxylesterase
MTPAFFGTSERRLFGIHAPARGGAARPRAAVLCYPWGQEYIRAHRSMKQLANLLSGAGRHVLRFDYFGTGDSAGEMLEADLPGWERDIETAMEEARDVSGASSVALVGLRLGANLAAKVAAAHPKQVESLVLWDPILSGEEYIAEILHTDAAHLQRPQPLQLPAELGRGLQVLGFPLSEGLQAQLREIDLTRVVAKLPKRTSVIVSHALPRHPQLQAELARTQGETSFEYVEGLLAWLQSRDLGAGAVPANVLERIAQRLATP